MNKKKIIYISLLFLVAVIVFATYFSYAFLIKKDEYHGKFNMVSGMLNYKVTSSDLIGDHILVEPGTTEITVSINSLNSIDSNYQLYYTAPSGVVVLYTTSNLSMGKISAGGTETVDLVINNTTEINQTVTFGVEGGLIGNVLELSSGKTAITQRTGSCTYQTNQQFDFQYTGAVQTFEPACSGSYKLEVWGAQGGETGNTATYGGRGGYSVGNITLQELQNVYVYVGGQGESAPSTGASVRAGGFNGGGSLSSGTTSYRVAAGGGASDIRIGQDSLYARVIVAGGGGGGYNENNTSWGSAGGYGGGTSGGSHVSVYSGSGTSSPGTQTTGNSFGIGQSTTGNLAACGGGWYGGSISGSYSAGSGGSGYVYTESTASNYPSGCLLTSDNYLTDASTIAGNISFLSPTGTNETGHTGDGYARITFLDAGGSSLPSINIKSSGKKAIISITGANQIYGYGISETSSVEPTYTELNSMNPKVTYESQTAGTYYVWVKDSENNVVKQAFTLSNGDGCRYTLNQQFDFDYTGSVQTFAPECDGIYKLEVWGAQGGSYNTSYVGGKGGYSSGLANLSFDNILYIYAGGQGQGGTTTGTRTGGFNGGGNAYSYSSNYTAAGGGASDIRIGQDSLYARVIVAGGGGGSGSYSTSYYYNGGYGGGTSGGTGSQYSTSYRAGTGGTATTAGTSYYSTTSNSTTYGRIAAFGLGGGANSTSYYLAGGGAGWYGGGYAYYASAGGGSGYVYTESTASNYPSGCLLSSDNYLTDAETKNGSASFTSPTGESETGHTGNGYARITYLGRVNQPPTISVAVNTSKVTINVSSMYQIYGYGISTSDSEEPTYTELNSMNPTIKYRAENFGTYYVWVKDVDGRISKKDFTIIDLAPSCAYEENQEFLFPYTGSVQTFTPECDGRYKLEVWGAQGGSNQAGTVGGNGGYSQGIINLEADANLYVYAGGQGLTGATSTALAGGFNGGGSVASGSNSSSNGGSGGGASDIRIGQDSLYARVIVAGGGGAQGYQGTPGAGGGTSGIQGNYSTTQYAYGGTQTAGGTCSGSYSGTCGGSGSFGIGGIGGASSTVSNRKGGAGGGGWYGGAGAHDGSGSNSGSGGGGSGYVYTESTASNYPSGCLLNSSYYLTEASTVAGNTQFTSPTGENETGHAGNGYAKITYLGD